MPKLPVIKTRELIRALEKLGFLRHHQVGSHAQYKHLDGRRVTVPIHRGKDIRKKILKGIINDIEISVEEFVKNQNPHKARLKIQLRYDVWSFPFDFPPASGDHDAEFCCGGFE